VITLATINTLFATAFFILMFVVGFVLFGLGGMIFLDFLDALDQRINRWRNRKTK
jgi:hypothetical protein